MVESDKPDSPFRLLERERQRPFLGPPAKLVGFNLDSSFHGGIDALVVVDLVETPTRILERHMGKDGARSFRQFHDAASCPP